MSTIYGFNIKQSAEINKQSNLLKRIFDDERKLNIEKGNTYFKFIQPIGTIFTCSEENIERMFNEINNIFKRYLVNLRIEYTDNSKCPNINYNITLYC